MSPAWLDPVRRALDVAGHPVPVFFRLDDAGWDTPRLRVLLDVFERAGIVPDVAVIPAEVDEPLARDLITRVRAGTVRIHQHGYRHCNHEPNGRKHEFGASRSDAQQRDDVAAGRLWMWTWFGGLPDPVFTPPWNRCTPVTPGVLAGCGFRVLSRDHTAAPLDPAGLVEVPVTVDWSRPQVALRAAERVAAGGPLGVMLHHAVLADDERLRVADLLRLVSAHPHLAATTIGALAAVPAPVGAEP